MKYKLIFNSIIEHIKLMLQSELFLSHFKKAKHFSRKRKLSMNKLIMYLLSSNKASMAINLGNVRDRFPKLDFPVISKQAVSKARQFIDPALFKELFYITIQEYYKHQKTFNLWNQYHLFAIDGSQIHMPYSKSVAETFGFQGDSRYDRKHYMGLGSILYDISQDYILDAELKHNKSSERELAKMHLQKLKQIKSIKNPLIIFDRGYYSAELFEHIVSQGYSCLMRIKASITSLTASSESDISKKLKSLSCKIRTVKVPLDTGETEYLVTNILDPNITPEMLKELYHKRWKVETKYYELKEHLELEKFNGSTAISIEQEFFITMMKSNCCSVIKNEADERITAGNTGRKQYQCCRSFLIGRLYELIPRYLLSEPVITTLDVLMKEAVQNKSEIRINRHNKRKMPRNHKVHCKNRKTTT